MKTQYENIYYYENRHRYFFKAHDLQNNIIQKSFKKLDDAVSYRNKFLLQEQLKRDNPITKQLTEKEKFEQCSVDEIPFFANAYNIYIENSYKYKVKPSTLYNFKTFCNMMCKYVGKIKIDMISASDWQNIFSTIQQKKHTSYSHLSDNMHRLSEMYKYFIQIGIVTENPLKDGLKLMHTAKNRRRAFTEEEKRIFLETAKTHNIKYYVLFRFFFETGCRRGELLALQWKDVDFVNHTIHISKSICRGLVDGKYKEFVGETKTKSSLRSIPISNRLCLILQYNYNKYKFDADMFVFPPNRGNYYKWISLQSVEKAFMQIRAKSGIDNSLTIHCIRHTFASKLLNCGVDIPTVQMLGGWSSPNVLLQIYAHSNNQHAKKMLQSVFK